MSDKSVDLPLTGSERPCPVCGTRHAKPFLKARLDPAKFSGATYASRKEPEFMCLPLVQCLTCQTVYTPCPPPENFLAQAYGESTYDSGEEANQAAKTYAEELAPLLRTFGHKGCAVDVGAGNGALLPYLLQAGFAKVVGIEPSRQAIEAALPEMRPFLREGLFTRDMIEETDLGLVCACMTLEHVPDPLGLLDTAFEALVPGGLVAVVVHNWKAPFNRLLGRYSPIIDVEHLQLFCPESIDFAFRRCGFETLQARPFANTYKLSYWMRLAPLPRGLKKTLAGTLESLALASVPVRLPVGNMIAVGRKPLS